jgi:hypothetical protein
VKACVIYVEGSQVDRRQCLFDFLLQVFEAFLGKKNWPIILGNFLKNIGKKNSRLYPPVSCLAHSENFTLLG